MEDGTKTLIFKVQYRGQCGGGFGRKVERKIELKDTQTLDDLQEAVICRSFGWDDPHMYAFFFDNKPYSENKKMEYSCDPEEDFGSEKPNPTKTKLKNIAMSKGQKFLFVFDFGDDHHFGIRFEGFGAAERGRKYPFILEEKGKAPKQY